MAIGLILAAVLLAIILGVLAFAIGGFNKLVTLRNRYKNAYAQIDVQLKRRYDLIPNLVEIAKGYIKHERETLENVTKARNIAYAASQRRRRQSRGRRHHEEPDFRRKRTGRHAGPPDDGFGTVSRPEGQPEHDAAHRGTDIHGKQNLLRPAVVQRLGHGLQSTDREVFPSNIIAERMFNFGPAELFVIDKPEQKLDAPKVSFS